MRHCREEFALGRLKIGNRIRWALDRELDTNNVAFPLVAVYKIFVSLNVLCTLFKNSNLGFFIIAQKPKYLSVATDA